jgi:hypothetical protein
MGETPSPKAKPGTGVFAWMSRRRLVLRIQVPGVALVLPVVRVGPFSGIRPPPSACPIRTAPTTGMSHPPRLRRCPHDKIPLMHFLGFGRKTKVPSCYRVAHPVPQDAQWPRWDGSACSSQPVAEAPSRKEVQHMTAVAILLMTTAAPSADPVAQPPAASWVSPVDEGPRAGRWFGRRRILFGRRSQGPQQQPGSAWVGPTDGTVQPVPVAAGAITSPVMSQGPQQQPGCACSVRPVPVAVSSAAGPIASPVMSQGTQRQSGGAAGATLGGAGRVVSVPVSGTSSAAEPNPAMSRPEVTTPPVPPEVRRLPAGPADPSAQGK